VLKAIDIVFVVLDFGEGCQRGGRMRCYARNGSNGRGDEMLSKKSLERM